MTHSKIVLTAGFAMFSMFFGSGNLVFPLLVGKESLLHYPWAILGFMITAVLVPFLGLVGMILYDGNYRTYFEKLGKVPAFLLIAAILMLIAPFGVVPRCITVAYGGFSLLMPSLPATLFSILFCLAIVTIIWTKSRVVDIIGLLLTPFKLGGIIILIIFGWWFGHNPVEGGQLTSTESFTNGLFKGYHTMDLMAAFFFSSTTVYYLRGHLSAQDDQKTLVRLSIQACLIGAFLLSLVYIGFIGLGAQYAPYLQDAQPEQLLVAIGGHALGAFAKPVIAIILAVGCLATAVILSTLFTDFVQQDLTKGRLTRPQAIFITMGITFVVSLLGFSKISSILGAILELTYPALLMLAIMNIVSKFTRFNHAPFAFWGMLALSISLKIWG
jgi:LIVCS family branched-chain amino acid:cation transporter